MQQKTAGPQQIILETQKLRTLQSNIKRLQIQLAICVKKMLITGHSSDGGENRTKMCVKPACKHIFLLFSTSDGHPMLLVRRRRARRRAV